MSLPADYPRVLHAVREDLPSAAVFDTGAWNLNLVVVRRSPGVLDAYDDQIHAVCRDEAGAWVDWWAWGTANPGSYYAVDHPTRGGTGTLVAPQQVRGGWKIGLHRGKTPALVQAGPLRIWRDRDFDGLPDLTGPIVQGAGYNLHPMGRADRPVGRWSAGCCGPTADRWPELWALVQRSAAIYGPAFTATIIERPPAWFDASEVTNAVPPS